MQIEYSHDWANLYDLTRYDNNNKFNCCPLYNYVF